MKNQDNSYQRRIIALLAVFGIFTSVFSSAPTAMAIAPSTYDVSYNGNGNTGGTSPTDGTIYSAGATVTVAGQNTLVKTGYSFGGWATGGGLGPVVTYSAGGSFTINDNTTLTAVWNLISTYDVSYNGNGNSGGTSPTDGTTYTSGATVVVAGQNTLVKTGYSFGGWASGGGAGPVVTYSPGGSLTINSNITLTAVWNLISTYDVSYNGNGNSGGTSPTSGTTYTSGATVVVAGQNTLVKTGYSFGGWASGGGAGPIVTYSPSGSFTINSNITLTAVWNLISTYTVVYIGNAHTSGSLPKDETVYSNGATVMVLSLNGLARTGYTFGGWASGGGLAPVVTYSPGGSFTINANTTLTAVWNLVSTYTLSYDGNGNTSGSPLKNETAYPSGATVLVAGQNTLVKTGYTFGGWASGGGLGPVVTYSPDGSFTINANTTLTAVWNLAPTYDVSYNGNGNTGGISPSDGKLYPSGATVLVAGQNTLVKTGYSFGGWASGGGLDPVVTYSPDGSFTINANTTLTAVWKSLSTYTLTYFGNGNSGGTSPASVSYLNGTTVTVAGRNTLVKTGYTFGGWTSGGGAVPLVTYSSGGSFIINSNIKLTAIWSSTTTTPGDGISTITTPSGTSTTVTTPGGGTSTTITSPGDGISTITTPDGGTSTTVTTPDGGTSTTVITPTTTTTTGGTSTTVTTPDGGTSTTVTTPTTTTTTGGTSTTTTTPGGTSTTTTTVPGGTSTTTTTVPGGTSTTTTTTTTPGGTSTTVTTTSTTTVPSGTSTTVTTPGGGTSTTVTTPGGGTSTTVTTPGGGTSTTVTTPGGTPTTTTVPGGTPTTTTVPGGGTSTTVTTPGGGTSTTTTVPGGGTSITITTPGGGTSTTTSTPGGGTSTTVTTPGGGTSITTTTPGGGTSITITTPGGGTSTTVTTPGGGTSTTTTPRVTPTTGTKTVFTITYLGNTNITGLPPTPTVGFGFVVLAANIGVLVKNGYGFDGWNTKADGSGISYQITTSYSLIANATLYAKWNPKIIYTITYNANGPTGGTAPPQTTGIGIEILRTNSGSLVKTGETFYGWNTKADGSGTSYRVAGSLLLSQNITLYAVFIPLIVSENPPSLIVNGKIINTAPPKKIALNQIVPVYQQFSTGLPKNAVGFQLYENGKFIYSSSLDVANLKSLVGPKDRVDVVAVGKDGSKSAPSPVELSKNPISLANINFETDSYALSGLATKILDQVAAVMLNHGYTKLEIWGYVDTQGSKASWILLSKNRALAVKNYMTKKLNGSGITILNAGRAQTQAVGNNNTAAGRALNRRVEIRVS